LLARIDQQTKIYHSSLSKQDSTNIKKQKQTQQTTKTKKQLYLKPCFFMKEHFH